MKSADRLSRVRSTAKARHGTRPGLKYRCRLPMRPSRSFHRGAQFAEGSVLCVRRPWTTPIGDPSSYERKPLSSGKTTQGNDWKQACRRARAGTILAADPRARGSRCGSQMPARLERQKSPLSHASGTWLSPCCSQARMHGPGGRRAQEEAREVTPSNSRTNARLALARADEFSSDLMSRCVSCLHRCSIDSGIHQTRRIGSSEGRATVRYAAEMGLTEGLLPVEQRPNDSLAAADAPRNLDVSGKRARCNRG